LDIGVFSPGLARAWWRRIALFDPARRVGAPGNDASKKRRIASARCAAKRETFRLAVADVPLEKQVYLDECGFALNLHRLLWLGAQRRTLLCRSALQPRPKSFGVRGLWFSQCGQSHRIVGLGATPGRVEHANFRGVRGPDAVPATGAGQRLDAGQRPHPSRGAVESHGRVKAMVEAAGCQVLYLPPYSPDFSPRPTLAPLSWCGVGAKTKFANARPAPMRKDNRTSSKPATNCPPRRQDGSPTVEYSDRNRYNGALVLTGA
jgi:hypothetical protein